MYFLSSYYFTNIFFLQIIPHRFITFSLKYMDSRMLVRGLGLPETKGKWRPELKALLFMTHVLVSWLKEIMQMDRCKINAGWNWCFEGNPMSNKKQFKFNRIRTLKNANLGKKPQAVKLLFHHLSFSSFMTYMKTKILFFSSHVRQKEPADAITLPFIVKKKSDFFRIVILASKFIISYLLAIGN